MSRKTGLGKGLNALIGESLDEITTIDAAETTDEEPELTGNVTNNIQPVEEVPTVYTEDDHVEIHGVVEREPKGPDEVELSQIVPNPDQPRTQFKPDEIEELATSIEKDGLLQPILVRQVGDTYQIIAGERRWQACRSLGLRTVPVRIMEADDDQAVELALIENIQRSDLNPIEEAYGYKRLIERRGMTQSQVAEVVSKGRSTIANALRLLDLPEEAQQMLYEDKITAGHARAILSIPTEEGRKKLTAKLIEGSMSVRDAENLARALSTVGTGQPSSRPRQATPDTYRKVAQELGDKLRTNVRVKTVRGKSRIEIEFSDEEDLRRLFDQIAGE
ncbi:MAG: ParB/RepB/Spo0J family partition protein [Eggerthellaceae bacterium]|nr:ParB/RepB/Spo0J family partition protein [Eggerthellaceae bacterium]